MLREPVSVNLGEQNFTDSECLLSQIIASYLASGWPNTSQTSGLGCSKSRQRYLPDKSLSSG